MPSRGKTTQERRPSTDHSGSRDFPGAYPDRKPQRHQGDAFKKGAAPEAAAIAGLGQLPAGQQPRQGVSPGLVAPSCIVPKIGPPSSTLPSNTPPLPGAAAPDPCQHLAAVPMQQHHGQGPPRQPSATPRPPAPGAGLQGPDPARPRPATPSAAAPARRRATIFPSTGRQQPRKARPATARPAQAKPRSGSPRRRQQPRTRPPQTPSTATTGSAGRCAATSRHAPSFIPPPQLPQTASEPLRRPEKTGPAAAGSARALPGGDHRRRQGRSWWRERDCW
nr:uncharacterized protein LOC127329046 [Lolium perenne]